MKKIYKVTLKTLTTVHIGSGKTLRKNQCVFNNRKVSVIDETKLTSLLLKRGLIDDFISNNTDLKTYLDNKRIDPASLTLYTLNIEGQSDSRKDINLFIKNPYNQVYIPGSSLKGALRTCLLNSSSEDNKNNPVFGKISVSDSDPIDNKCLAIYQKIDYSKEDKGESALPIYRECIKPGTELTFTLSIEGITLADLEKGMQETKKAYYNWSRGFKYGDNTGLKNVIYLGGGVGIVSKTLHYKEKPVERAKKDIYEILQKQFPLYRKFKSVPRNVPISMKLSRHGSNYLEMGKCQLTFKEI